MTKLLTCGQWPTPGRSTFSALGYSFCILSALCGLIHGSSAPHSSSTGCRAERLRPRPVCSGKMMTDSNHVKDEIPSQISETDGALVVYLVKLFKKNIDWRALPSDDPVEDLCRIAVLCRPGYRVDKLIIQILMVDVHLLEHLQHNALFMLATIHQLNHTTSLTKSLLRGLGQLHLK